MIEQIILAVHVLVALAILGLILLQQGKGADMGASFGGGSSQTLFGAAGGGNVLTRATAILSAVFFATSLSLAVVAKQKASNFNDLPETSALEAVAEEVTRNEAELPLALELPEEALQESPAAADIIDEIPE